MHYYLLYITWDNIIVAGVVVQSTITHLAVAAFEIVTANHANDWNETRIGIVKLQQCTLMQMNVVGKLDPRLHYITFC